VGTQRNIAGISAIRARVALRHALIQPGQLAIQVREKCGDPVSEELIGYTLRGAPPGLRGEREYKIEQWIYGPDQGYYHILIFEAGRLHDIDKTKQ
jgi:hypothetical protein